MWGQGASAIRFLKGVRIIPTRVGTSSDLQVTSMYLQDHPHACGDKDGGDLETLRLIGSSPRVWGQVAMRIYAVAKGRIIPTRVGTRIDCTRIYCVTQDHPHACGDKMCDSGLRRGEIGSSPRVWGQGIHQCLILLFKRIIPTRVGTRQNA